MSPFISQAHILGELFVEVCGEEGIAELLLLCAVGHVERYIDLNRALGLPRGLKEPTSLHLAVKQTQVLHDRFGDLG